MQTIPGGIGKLMEHWIKQYHQTGHMFDLAYCRMGSLSGQAAICSSVEKRGRNPPVQMNKQFLLEKSSEEKKMVSSSCKRWKENSHQAGEKRRGTCWDSRHRWVKKLKLFVRSWKSRRILMSWMNLQSWKQNYSGSLWHDTCRDKPREDKPSQAGWVFYDYSSMHHHKNGSLYPYQVKTRWAATRQDKTHQAGWLLYDNSSMHHQINGSLYR